MNPITDITSAVAVLNEKKWRGRGDWELPHLHTARFIEVIDRSSNVAMSRKFLWNEDAIAIANSLVQGEQIAELEAKLAAANEALEDLVCQFGYWNDGVGGITTGGLSALEGAFEILGWDDPHLLPEMCCDEPGCKKQISTGTTTPSGYRQTCHDHIPTTSPPSATADCEPQRET